MSKLRIAVAGAGSIGRRHIELIQASRACELAAIVDPAPATGELATTNAVPLYASLEALFAELSCDGVIIATPNRLHIPAGLICVQHRVPALVEKPIADAVMEAMQLVDAAEAAGVALLIGHHRRYSAFMVRARECVESGALGTFLLSDTAAATQSWEQTSGENASYAQAADEDCYLLAGTRGSLGVPTMRLRTYPGERSWWQPFDTVTYEVDRVDPLVRQLEHFCAVIRGEAQPLVSGRDAVQTLKVTLAIRQSAATGQTVSIT